MQIATIKIKNIACINVTFSSEGSVVNAIVSIYLQGPVFISFHSLDGGREYELLVCVVLGSPICRHQPWHAHYLSLINSCTFPHSQNLSSAFNPILTIRSSWRLLNSNREAVRVVQGIAHKDTLT